MGYYLAVPCYSAKARDYMLAFLRKHLQVPDDWEAGSPQLGKKVCAYIKRPLDIGYYSSGMTLEARELADNLLRWIALRIGRTRKFRNEWIPNYPEVVAPYTLYEDEPVPVLVCSKFPQAPDPWELAERYALCDEFGWARSMRGPDPGEDPTEDAATSPHMMEIRRRKHAAGVVIRAELTRLDTIWKQPPERTVPR